MSSIYYANVNMSKPDWAGRVDLFLLKHGVISRTRDNVASIIKEVFLGEPSILLGIDEYKNTILYLTVDKRAYIKVQPYRVDVVYLKHFEERLVGRYDLTEEFYVPAVMVDACFAKKLLDETA